MEKNYTLVKEGISRCILQNNGSLMAVEVLFDRAVLDTMHQHVHEQITYVLEGEFIFTIEGKDVHKQKGDTLYFAPNIPHCASSKGSGKLLDIFTPIREDFVK